MKMIVGITAAALMLALGTAYAQDMPREYADVLNT